MSNIYNINLNQGETYTLTVTVTGANYTSATAKIQFRAAPAATVLDTFTSSPPNGLAISTSIGGVHPDTVTLTIDASRSTGYSWASGLYDLLITNSDTTTKRPLQGAVTISKQITV